MTNRPKILSWAVSNCEKASSGRMEYVKSLSKYLKVDIFGKCGDYPCANKSGIFPCDFKIGQDYKFYLSFENSLCLDYVTEKLFNTFMLPIVPIVLGGANYADFAPPKSFINAADFKTPKHLADYLIYLDQNDEEYLKYFEWKTDFYIIRRFPICQICQMLNTNLPRKSYSDLHKWWFGPNGNDFCLESNQIPFEI